MKIAILTRRLYPPGGAERTMEYISEQLSKNHTVKMYGFTEKKGDVPDNSITEPMPASISLLSPRLNKIFKHFRRATTFRKPVQQFDPDLILAHHRPSLITPYLKHTCDARVIIFVHDLSQIKFPHGSIIGKKYSYINKYLHRIAYQQADVVVANSKFTAKAFNSAYGFYPTVIYPCVNLDKHRVHSTGDQILFVNPTYDKGVDTMIEVAKRLPRKSFLVVGPDPPDDTITQQITNQENIHFCGYVDDMTTTYKNSKLVLYPSRCPEAFGRIPIEAGASGIPTIAANRGGLPESVGIDDCIVHTDLANDYVNCIQTVLNNYSDYSAAARLNAWKKSGELQFVKIVSQINKNDC